MSNGVISVIVPIYNVEKYLDRCIESVVLQTYQNLEIILVDDGSPDRCPEMCDRWALQDSRIRVIHKPNGGVSSARNAGLEIASGEFIVFLDSDDCLDVKMLELLLQEMQDNRVGIVECGLQEITGNESKVHISHSTCTKADIAVSHILLWDGMVGTALWNKLFRREVIDSLRFQETLQYGEDTPYLYEALKRTDVYVQIPYIGYYHFRREDSLVGNAFQSYKLHSLLAAKQVALKVQDDFPHLAELGSCHVAFNAYSLLGSLLLTPGGKKLYAYEYGELLSAIRNSSLSVVKKYKSQTEYLRFCFVRLFPVCYEYLLTNRHKIKRHRKSDL